jgi:hypothetical protein
MRLKGHGVSSHSTAPDRIENGVIILHLGHPANFLHCIRENTTPVENTVEVGDGVRNVSLIVRWAKVQIYLEQRQRRKKKAPLWRFFHF